MTPTTWRTDDPCPVCGTGISWYDNIPVFSYMILGTRCRHCHARIHWRYPVVEFLTAIAAIPGDRIKHRRIVVPENFHRPVIRRVLRSRAAGIFPPGFGRQ